MKKIKKTKNNVCGAKTLKGNKCKNKAFIDNLCATHFHVKHTKTDEKWEKYWKEKKEDDIY